MKKRVAKRIFVLMTLIVSFLLIGTFLVSEICESLVFADIKNGGAIYVGNHSSANLAGGTISGNTATNGGGVYVADGGTFTMNGSSSGMIRVDESGNVDQNGNYVLFGSYPKTYQSDTSVITNKTDENGYYIGTDGTSRFAKANINLYDSSYEFNGGKTIDESEGYFKVEAIKWRILSIQDGKVLLLCEDIIDARNFNYSTDERTINGSMVYANNYKYSDIRAWLNGYEQAEGNVKGESWSAGGFLQKTFTTAERDSILTTEVDNSASTTSDSSNTYACENTHDKIFLLSYQDVYNTDYGLGVSVGNDVEILRKSPTDYAIANGVCYEDDGGFFGTYWLRSPFSTALESRCVDSYEGQEGYKIVNSEEIGVVPAIHISESTLCDNSVSISGNTATSGKGNDIYNAGTFIMNSGTLGEEKSDSENGSEDKTDSSVGLAIRVDKDGDPDENGNYVLFGSYPQTYQPNTSVITSRQDSKGYYLGTDGNRYAKMENVTIVAVDEQKYVFKNGTTITNGETYYFKVEPLKWRILKIENGQVFLFCEEVINARSWNNFNPSITIDGLTIYTNNYKYSDVRAWLNGYVPEEGNTVGKDWSTGGFLQKAFSTSEQNLILITNVDNSVETTGNSSGEYACENTEDKIFLLSYQDAINPDYGFKSSYIWGSDGGDLAKRKSTTDYARAHDIYYSTTTGMESLNNVQWWLRSPSGVSGTYIDCVGYNIYFTANKADHEDAYYGIDYGIAPALYIPESILSVELINDSDSENQEGQTIEGDFDIFNTGTMNLFGGTVYGNIYSETSFSTKMNATIKGQITLGNSAIINVLDYAGITPEYQIIISETRGLGTILTLNGSSVAPDLTKFDISGYDSESYKISVEQESTYVWNVMLEELNIYVRVNANGDVSATGDYILFGSYPKTIKADSVTIDESDVDKKGYYLGSDGNRYAKVVATPASDSDQQFSNQTTVVSGKTYYFKVEKIKWRILKTTNNKALLLAEDQLYGMFFDDEESDSNNYAESEVRAFLNGLSTSFSVSYYDNGFLQTAFSTVEQNYIQTTTVDNSASTTSSSSNTYACENTSDKIFLLSYQESINSAYGFSVGSTSDTLRQQKATDFAVACGAYSNGCWWLRSPASSSSSNVLMVDPSGFSGDQIGAHGYSFGVVPALWLDLGTGTSSFASNTKNEKTEDSTFEKISNVLSVDSMFALVSVLGISKISTKTTIGKPLFVENKKKRKSFKLASKKR